MPWNVPPERRKQLQDLEQVKSWLLAARHLVTHNSLLQLLQQQEMLLGGPAGSDRAHRFETNKLAAKTKKLRQALWTHGTFTLTFGALM